MITQRQRALTAQLNLWAKQYYEQDAPTVSDAEYDAAYDDLRLLEQESGQVLPDSPTHRVGGAPLEAFEPHEHLSPLWSLDKAQGHEAVQEWLLRITKRDESDAPAPVLAVEQKYDGLSICLTYREGVLQTAATRGNGAIGENITPQARTVASIPLTITYLGELEVQGEVFMKKSVLKTYNQTAAVPLKNPRNGAAGALRQLDPRVTARRKLSACFYHVNTIHDAPYADYREMLDFLQNNGFPVPHVEFGGDIMAAIDHIEQQRDSLDYDIDGAVIKISDTALRQRLGYTDKFPRWAIAYKFAPQEQTVRVLDISWQVGRTGRVTPLAHVEPVTLAGAMVTRATLNNYEDLTRKAVRIGGRVWIRRSNEVIPEIMGAVDAEGVLVEKPTACPVCGDALIESGPLLFCSNKKGCAAQLVERLVHFASRNCMDIEGFSVRTAAAAIEAGVARLADLYTMDTEAWQRLPGFAEKKARNLAEALEKSKTLPLPRFLDALGIPNIGRATSRALAARFGTLAAIMQAGEEAFAAVPDIGPVIARGLSDFFSDAENLGDIEALLAVGVCPQAQAAQPVGPWLGMKFCVTGSLSAMTRDQAQAAIIAQGGTAVGSVSAKTSVLVAGEEAGSKLQKAQTLQLEIWDEARFLAELAKE